MCYLKYVVKNKILFVHEVLLESNLMSEKDKGRS